MAETKRLKTVRDYLRYALTRMASAPLFYGHGTDNAWDDAVFLVMRSLQLPLTDNQVFLDARLTTDECDMLAMRIDRRVNDRVPVPYLLGEAWFMGLPFEIDERVLIPRSSFGELLTSGLQPWLGDREPTRILDLCCGSGCIGIAAAMAFPEAQVELADISADAISLATKNRQTHGLTDRVAVRLGDGLAAVEGRFDVILCNPPYVDAADMASLPAEYRHEPTLALASGDDGLDFVRQLLANARNYLTEEGLLFVEVGNSDTTLEAVFADVPFTWVEFEQGEGGIFLLTAADLDAYASSFALASAAPAVVTAAEAVQPKASAKVTVKSKASPKKPSQRKSSPKKASPKKASPKKVARAPKAARPSSRKK